MGVSAGLAGEGLTWLKLRETRVYVTAAFEEKPCLTLYGLSWNDRISTTVLQIETRTAGDQNESEKRHQ